MFFKNPQAKYIDLMANFYKEFVFWNESIWKKNITQKNFECMWILKKFKNLVEYPKEEHKKAEVVSFFQFT